MWLASRYHDLIIGRREYFYDLLIFFFWEPRQLRYFNITNNLLSDVLSTAQLVNYSFNYFVRGGNNLNEFEFGTVVVD